jgi:hypothetical protein
MTNQLAIPPPFGTAVASPEPLRNLTLSVDSSKRLDHFLEKLNGGVD